jgi:hypothetical protein
MLQVVPRARLNLSDEQFDRIKKKIDGAIDFHAPRGSGGTMQPFLRTVEAIFAAEGVAQGLYWEDVWIRAGCVEMEKYNKPDRKSVSLEHRNVFLSYCDKLFVSSASVRKKRAFVREWLQVFASLMRRRTRK